jgi:magnesium transporter
MVKTAASCLVRQSDGGVRELTPDELGDLRQLGGEPGSFAWLDLPNPGPEQLALLRRQLDLHPLALEDLEKRRQRTKLDTYAGQYVIVAYELLHDGERSRLSLSEIHIIAGDRYLVTVHWSASPVIDDVRRRFAERNNAVEGGVGTVLYHLLDGIADGYFPFLDRVSERVDRLEEEVVTGPPAGEALRRILRVKRELLELRRTVAPLRDVANSLLRRDLDIVEEESVPYYQDLYDHLIRVIDTLDLYRDLLAAALDVSLSVTSNNLNIIVKRLTGFTVILMVPTLIAGVYGMNFHFMPELAWPVGYPFALGLMALAMIGLAIFFRARDWF